MPSIQGEYFGDSELEGEVEAFISAQLTAYEQPSAWDLLGRVEERLG